jgi:hypothetical protein
MISDKLFADKNLTQNEIWLLHNFYGISFNVIGDYKKALENYFKCLEI